MKKLVQKPLGEILIDAKAITREQLEEALKAQKEKGGLIGEVLVSLKYTTEQAIAKALTTQYGFPYLPLVGYDVDKSVAKTIPENVAKQYGVVAVDRVGNVLTVAMSNPLNQQAVEDIEMISHCKIQVFISTNTDVRQMIQKCYAA